MSMIQELESARAEALGIKAEFEKFKSEAAEFQAALVEAQAVEVGQLKAEILTLTEGNSKLAADLSASQAAVVDAQAKIAVVEAERGAIAGKLEKAEKALANPAFADAALPGASNALPEGGEASPPSGKSPTWDEFHKIKDPAARTEFWQKNETKLRAEMAAVNAG